MLSIARPTAAARRRHQSMSGMSTLFFLVVVIAHSLADARVMQTDGLVALGHRRELQDPVRQLAFTKYIAWALPKASTESGGRSLLTHSVQGPVAMSHPSQADAPGQQDVLTAVMPSSSYDNMSDVPSKAPEGSELSNWLLFQSKDAASVITAILVWLALSMAAMMTAFISCMLCWQAASNRNRGSRPRRGILRCCNPFNCCFRGSHIRGFAGVAAPSKLSKQIVIPPPEPVHPPASEEGNARECVVCLEERRLNSEIAVFPCKHFTCINCYNEMFSQSLMRICPLCRAPIAPAFTGNCISVDGTVPRIHQRPPSNAMTSSQSEDMQESHEDMQENHEDMQEIQMSDSPSGRGNDRDDNPRSTASVSHTNAN